MITESDYNERRPKTVLTMAAFLFVATVMAMITGTSLLWPSPFWERLWDINRPAYVKLAAFGRISGALLMALGAGTAAAGIGLLHRKKWVWWFAMVLFAINGCGDVISFFVTRSAQERLWRSGRHRIFVLPEPTFHQEVFQRRLMRPIFFSFAQTTA